jgi:predicted O-linked N-acetylglucosamine transferase (SPINDLY family)
VDRDEQFAEAVRAHQAGDHASAERGYLELLASEPEHPSVLLNLAAVFMATDRTSDAVELLSRAVANAPGHANAWVQKGLAHHHLAELDLAEVCFARALEVDDRHTGALNNWAMTCAARRRFEQAFQLYQRVLAIDPSFVPALQNLGVLFLELGRLSEAQDCYERALAKDPGSGPMHCNLANVLTRRGRAGEALTHLAKAILACPEQAGWHSNLLLTLHYLDGISREEVFREHRRWANLRRIDRCRLPPQVAGDPGRRLRIGYVSPDFRSHAVAFFIAPILRAHDRERYEITGYSNVQARDAITDRLQGLCDRWRDVYGSSEEQLAAQIRADGIDVLVDLAGHTSGHRLLAFALAPAPVQISYLGYPDTTGIAAIGFRLSDRHCDPEGSQAFHSEQLLYIDGGMHCYEPPLGTPKVAPAPLERARHLTFGSFNNTSKITSTVIATWSRVLAAIPSARLMMKFPTLADERTARDYREQFAHHGIEPSRVTMRGAHYEHADHLADHAEVDVVLDTYPYNGTTTTCEAMWMGVPVLTRCGDRHVARVGVSLLQQVGLDRFIAADEESLVARAKELDSDSGRAELVYLRGRLRQQMSQSPLCDGEGKARAIERCFREAWQRARDGEGS